MERNVFLYWNGIDFKLIKLLRNIIYFYSYVGKGYNVIFCNRENIINYIDIPEVFDLLQPMHQADYVRVHLLYKYGGIWLDSDTLLLHNLDSLFDDIENNEGFFIRNHRDDSSVVLINSVFGSKKNTQLFKKWIEYLEIHTNINTKYTILGSDFLKIYYLNNTASILLENYTIYYGPDNMLPLNWDYIVKDLMLTSYNNYINTIRNFQPLIILFGTLYRFAEKYEINDYFNIEAPLKYFLNKSFENMFLQDYNNVEITHVCGLVEITHATLVAQRVVPSYSGLKNLKTSVKNIGDIKNIFYSNNIKKIKTLNIDPNGSSEHLRGYIDYFISMPIFLPQKIIIKIICSGAVVEQFLQLGYKTVQYKKGYTIFSQEEPEVEKKNILVTGGIGFIGSNFCVNIIDRVSKLIIIDKFSYSSDIKNIDEIINNNKVVVINDDITTPTVIDDILIKYDINIIIHFAAQTHVDNSYNGFFDFIKDNVLATHILLESCRKNNIEKILMMSTDEVYGPSLNIQLDENAKFNPTNPYAASKASAEMIINAYKCSYNIPIIIIRCNNVYGPKQYPDKVIPKFITQIINNENITIHGNGSKVRDFIYVLDVCKAIEVILDKGTIGDIYNISEDNPHTIIDLANKLSNKLNTDLKIENITDRPFNDDRYYINSDKLRNLGWKPETKWEDGLNITIEWIKLQHSKPKGEI